MPISPQVRLLLSLFFVSIDFFVTVLKLIACCEFPLYAKEFPTDADAATSTNSSDGLVQDRLEKGWENSTQPLYQNA